MMRPDLDCSANAQQYRYANLLESSSLPSESVNCPEENDETADEANLVSLQLNSPSGWPGSRVMANKRLFQPSFSPYQPPIGLPAGYSPPTPFPSWSEGCPSDSNFHKGGWPHPSYASGCSEGGYPSSLPSRFPSEYPGYSGQNQSRSLPGQYSPSLVSLEPPYPLRSNSPAAGMPPFCLQPYPGAPRGLACCGQCPMKGFQMAPFPHHHPRPGYIVPYAPPGICGHHDVGSTHSGYPPPQPRQKLAPYTSPLSLEQRKVFVTYEADSDNHVNEIIKFVALLRHNGFDMHIDVFEQQFKSISKIDFMEKYISEKDYLIIIVISPKYYETVTGGYMSLENDERTLNTVYIHKQLQNEFIQNGSRNFRFIPILFPGAKQCHVPTWLQNTHVYGWPRDRDDILRRLMRVEKYNPPPIGVLPTIVSIPL